MRAFLTRHAAALYIAGGIALVAGVAIALHVALLAGAIIAGVGCVTMGATHGRVGA